MPPAPSHTVEICTREAVPCGVTVNVVTRLEPASDSVITRPGSGSATVIRYSRARPPAVTVKRVTVPAPTPPASSCAEVRERRRQEVRVVLAIGPASSE